MVLVLALAALAIYGVVYGIKKVSRPRAAQDPHLKVLARTPLSTDTYAAVLSLGGKAWLVGGASGGVNLLAEITDTETLETLLLEDAENAAAPAGLNFRTLMQRFTGRHARQAGAEPASPSAASAVGGSFLDRLRKRRERLQ
jgi:flagellar biogenesis protein FliO